MDSGVSPEMMSKVDLTLEEQDPITVSKKPTTAITANGTIRATEQATVHVKDLALFVCVQLLKDSPAVLHLGKLCEKCVFVCTKRKPITKLVKERHKYFLHIGQFRAIGRNQRRFYFSISRRFT